MADHPGHERIRVGVFGAGGRMGSTVCAAVVADDALDLVAAVDPHHQGIEVSSAAGVSGCDVQISGDPEVFVAAGVQVAIDFTEAQAARQNLLFLARHGMHAVVGTTGFSDADLDLFARRFSSSNCLIAPNFAIGALLMMRFAVEAAPLFDTVEVIEFHHDQKVDAPSGTASLTAERIAAASADWSPDPTTLLNLDGVRGGTVPGGVRVHSVRMRGMVAHQEVILGTTGQTLTIRHDSLDRTSFMPGVVMAVKAIASTPGVTIGLDTLLGL
ncbi:MAG: 4-hydroxy-tetrahydrodipicolinate reductase [Microthrixaceae bacterium]